MSQAIRHAHSRAGVTSGYKVLCVAACLPAHPKSPLLLGPPPVPGHPSLGPFSPNGILPLGVLPPHLGLPDVN